MRLRRWCAASAASAAAAEAFDATADASANKGPLASLYCSHLSPAESLSPEPIQRSTIVAGPAPRPIVRGSSSAQLDVLSVPPCILPLKAGRVLLYSPAAHTYGSVLAVQL